VSLKERDAVRAVEDNLLKDADIDGIGAGKAVDNLDALLG
jgi:hypothetical protein